MEKIREERNLDNFKRVYYPGSGDDVETLKFILSALPTVEDIIYCDYSTHISPNQLANLKDQEVIKEIALPTAFFNQSNWKAFWYNHARCLSSYPPLKQLKSTLHILFNRKSFKPTRFFQLATESVGTYQILEHCSLRPDLIFLADHGYGSNWDPNCWGSLIAIPAKYPS